MPETALLVTCEHGGNRVPARYRRLFAGRKALLASHRGWDPGALALARLLAGELDAPLLFCDTTRLLADPNRSEGHPALFSELTRPLPAPERQALLDRLWRPHRQAVRQAAADLIAGRGQVLHLAVHSFTPVLHDRERTMDLGLLYDPARPREARLAAAWKAVLTRRAPGLRVRRNAPYRGASDGLATFLRRALGPAYLGLELETNQRLFSDPRAAPPDLARLLADALRNALTLPAPAG
ncbi:MAG: N-formylglutamate amidohydrolase [Thermodesulfobacteriota bacterium]